MFEQVILKIQQLGHPVLRQQARIVTVDEILSLEMTLLIQAMHNTLRDAPGVGLAAPQVGLALQLIIIEDRPQYQQALSAAELAQRKRQPIPFHVIFNPKIVAVGTQQVSFAESCLSFNAIAPVARYETVTVSGLNEKAQPVTINAEGWYARILQHEIDHLQGIICIDHMSPQTITTRENFLRFHA